ncbi:MAG: lipopolysaccharide biosynthesis protein [Bacteroidaceae bacterium]|nr:lipopolysaccharide biosynthesis protein [Bacteroidaceae bacterium]
MEEENKELTALAKLLSNNAPYIEEDEGIDIMEYVKQLWNGRKTVIIFTCVFIVLGFVAALTMKRTYSVSTVMVPQVGSKSNSSLSSLASLAGFDLGTTTSATDLSPLIYPQIVSSVPFRKELMYTPLHYAAIDTAVSMYTYTKDIAKPTVMSTVKKYTIGLPGVILGAIKGKKPDVALPVSDADDSPKPLVLTKDEVKILKQVGESVSLSVDKKEGYITLNVTGSEPIMTAELAMKAQQLLQEEITRFRVEKSQNELDYIQARYDEIKAEAESYQEQLAKINDRSQNMTGSYYRIEQERIQAKYNLANGIYNEMAKQLEQGKIQVKKDTPVFTVIQPVTVPSQPSNSRSKTLIVWTFLGFILGCGIVLAKGYWPKLKEQFNA